MLLAHRRNSDLRAYFLWGPFLEDDSEELARINTERFLAPNTAYFWIPDLALFREMATVLDLGAGKIAWDVYLLYERGVTWDDLIPPPTYWQHQLHDGRGEKLNIYALEVQIESALRVR